MYRIGKEEIEAVSMVIQSKNLFKINNDRQETMHCEMEAKSLFNVNYALLMSSGKAALISALTALGIGPGDEVIVPAYTYIATAIAVTAVGAIPVIAEIDDTMTLDVKDMEKKISKYTKAIIPVHIQGFPCDMDAIIACAKRHNLKIVEDACQADGGSYHGERLGAIGDAGALSFNQFKIISSGEGGMLLTNNRQLFERSLIYHDSSAVAFFGKQLSDDSEKTFCGTEYRTNEITAAIIREQFKRLDGILADLRKNKKIITDALKGYYEFARSNDSAGDCGTTIAFRFEDEKSARKFNSNNDIGSVIPIDTDKHIYSQWGPIMEKRGAFNEKMDPFKMEINKDLNHNYSVNMCQKTLEYLSKTVYVSVNPDWNEHDVEEIITLCKKAI